MNHLSLFELNQLIRATLDTHLEPSYWVVAEIGEIRITQKGHCYMELVQKQDDETVAKMRGNIWAYNYRNLSQWFESITGKSITKGMQMLLNVVVQFHEVYGFSLIIRDIDPRFTMGERAKKRQEIIEKLKEEGIWSLNRSLPLPVVPQRLAVISSPTAAGFGDFIHHLENNPNGFTFDIRLFKAVMQGEEAEESLLQALERINNIHDRYDLIILIRGGGSQIDLDCFDSYVLNKMIARMPLPVITGIGHERDETISDLVAHTNLKTPTAVSEFLINGFSHFESVLDGFVKRLQISFSLALKDEQRILSSLMHRLYSGHKNRIGNGVYYLKEKRNRIEHISSSKIVQAQSFLTTYHAKLELLSPDKILSRGYTLSSIENRLIRNVKAIEKGSIMKTISSDREIESTVEEVKPR